MCGHGSIQQLLFALLRRQVNEMGRVCTSIGFMGGMAGLRNATVYGMPSVALERDGDSRLQELFAPRKKKKAAYEFNRLLPFSQSRVRDNSRRTVYKYGVDNGYG